jgi:hypothetical protein
MIQPLITRPGYGEGHPALPRSTSEKQAESGLPEGGPSDHGLPLDSKIPGWKTFTKPLDSTSTHPKGDEPVDRIDGGYSIPKDRDRIDTDEDSANDQPGTYGLGPRDPDDYSKTKYPYRDDKQNWHNASAEFVAGLYHLRFATDCLITSDPQVKTARTLGQMLQGLDRDILRRSRQARVQLKRADITNLRWIFSVTGNNTYAVRVKASRPKPNVSKMNRMNLHVACSCPAWRWQGPEFHAQRRDYQDPKTALQGTASTPNIRDPERDNRVCKHVAAVLSFVNDWDVPASRSRIRQAMEKRACNVCVAEQALRPASWKEGHPVRWSEAPLVIPIVYVRARAEKPESAPGRYQVRKEGQDWSEKWIPTNDLAGSIGRWGFDVNWDVVPQQTKIWLQS